MEDFVSANEVSYMKRIEMLEVELKRVQAEKLAFQQEVQAQRTQSPLSPPVVSTPAACAQIATASKESALAALMSEFACNATVRDDLAPKKDRRSAVFMKTLLALNMQQQALQQQALLAVTENAQLKQQVCMNTLIDCMFSGDM